jgi:DNA (cytosine-5)-methyltransferase 1
MEASGYAIGAADMCAAGIGAPHIRQRLWFVGERLDDTAGARHVGALAGAEGEARDEARLRLSGERRGSGGLANAPLNGRRQGVEDGGRLRSGDSAEGTAGRSAIDSNVSGGLAHTSSFGRERGQAPAPGHDDDGSAPGGAESEHGVGLAGPHWLHQDGARPTDGQWRVADWLFCRDGRWRPVEPGTFPLAHGAPARVGRLRAYGNAIVPQVAAEVIGAYLDARP